MSCRNLILLGEETSSVLPTKESVPLHYDSESTQSSIFRQMKKQRVSSSPFSIGIEESPRNDEFFSPWPIMEEESSLPSDTYLHTSSSFTSTNPASAMLDNHLRPKRRVTPTPSKRSLLAKELETHQDRAHPMEFVFNSITPDESSDYPSRLSLNEFPKGLSPTSVNMESSLLSSCNYKCKPLIHSMSPTCIDEFDTPFPNSVTQLAREMSRICVIHQ